MVVRPGSGGYADAVLQHIRICEAAELLGVGATRAAFAPVKAQ